MSLRCQVTNKRVMSGNNVSHSQRKTRRVFKPNLHKKTFWVPSLKRKVSLTLSKKGLKMIDKNGIDQVVQQLLVNGEKI